MPWLSALTRALSAVMGALPWADATDEARGRLHSEVEELSSDCISDSTS